MLNRRADGRGLILDFTIPTPREWKVIFPILQEQVGATALGIRRL
jgi:hypothetical protein